MPKKKQRLEKSSEIKIEAAIKADKDAISPGWDREWVHDDVDDAIAKETDFYDGVLADWKKTLAYYGDDAKLVTAEDYERDSEILRNTIKTITITEEYKLDPSELSSLLQAQGNVEKWLLGELASFEKDALQAKKKYQEFSDGLIKIVEAQDKREAKAEIAAKKKLERTQELKPKKAKARAEDSIERAKKRAQIKADKEKALIQMLAERAPERAAAIAAAKSKIEKESAARAIAKKAKQKREAAKIEDYRFHNRLATPKPPSTIGLLANSLLAFQVPEVTNTYSLRKRKSTRV